MLILSKVFRLTLLSLALLAGCLALPAQAQTASSIEEIQALRLQGLLEQAQAAAEAALPLASGDPATALALHLELAKIHDRIGLHQNSRPVLAAKAEIEAAERLAPDVGPEAQAQVQLALGDYYYRAEMSERLFKKASYHAGKATRQFQELGDFHGQADSVHLQGLVALQRQELDKARALFEQSLQLDQQGGDRVFFLGEYERHVGFIDVLEGNHDLAIPHFERSLAARNEAGAVDASLFAAATLARSLVEVGRVDDAAPHLLYALLVAERIGSPVGTARAGLVLGQAYWQKGDKAAARVAFELSIDAAASVSDTEIGDAAREALARL